MMTNDQRAFQGILLGAVIGGCLWVLLIFLWQEYGPDITWPSEICYAYDAGEQVKC